MQEILIQRIKLFLQHELRWGRQERKNNDLSGPFCPWDPCVQRSDHKEHEVGRTGPRPGQEEEKMLAWTPRGQVDLFAGLGRELGSNGEM